MLVGGLCDRNWEERTGVGCAGTAAGMPAGAGAALAPADRAARTERVERMVDCMVTRNWLLNRTKTRDSNKCNKRATCKGNVRPDERTLAD